MFFFFLQNLLFLPIFFTKKTTLIFLIRASFAKVVSLCWNLQSILMDILCRLNAKFWQILVKVEKPVFVSFLFYCFSVIFCLPQLYVNWIRPISRKLLDRATGNLLDWMQDNNSFSGLGLINDDVKNVLRTIKLQ